MIPAASNITGVGGQPPSISSCRASPPDTDDSYDELGPDETEVLCKVLDTALGTAAGSADQCG